MAGSEHVPDQIRALQRRSVDNFFVVETDFDTLEAYQRESDATSQDEEWMKLIRSNIEHVVEGSSETEIFQAAARIR